MQTKKFIFVINLASFALGASPFISTMAIIKVIIFASLLLFAGHVTPSLCGRERVVRPGPAARFTKPDTFYTDPEDSTLLPFNVVVGRSEILGGPWPNLADNPFLVLSPPPSSSGARTVLGYSANGETWLLQNSTIGSLSTNLTRITDTTLGAGPKGSLDECGAWLNSADVQGNQIAGWYHAECLCDYDVGQTHKSVAYAQSSDLGKTFVKVNYPNNHVITGANFTAKETTGAGDHTVVTYGGYYYMFYYEYPDWKPTMARSKVSDGGRPNTWFKYFNGQFTEPGLGGRFTPVPDTSSFVASVSILGNDTLISLYTGTNGIFMSYMPASGIASPNWKPVADPLFYSNLGTSPWDRTPSSPELWAYTMVISLSPSATYIYSTYLFPGQGFADRYIVRNQLTFSTKMASSDQSILNTLSQYHSKQNNDYWETNSPVLGYDHVTDLGYVMTSSPSSPAGVLLVSCYLDVDKIHVVTTSSCASFPYAVLVKPLGWIWQGSSSGSRALYRCVTNSGGQLLSLDSSCAGQGKVQQMLGYILQDA
eukprot:TRINITY_DN4791_c0_g1_i1.p1 TRINITY_DN4791_c0_g1~~TRINITY_DN4791_c0_g1_i1.p1  ORF type:complete len:538 (-),score=80.63 TRINITY_DN4791_c0_g1_i1:42-1655(-)